MEQAYPPHRSGLNSQMPLLPKTRTKTINPSNALASHDNLGFKIQKFEMSQRVMTRDKS
jgi:hypothetical protein